MKGCRKMSILTYWEHDEGISKLAEYAVRRNLIPFIGAGFSAGSETAGGCVPDGPTVCAEMIELILKSFPDLAKGKLDTCSFTQIADLFFKYISVADRAAFFEKSFTETNLSASHQDFINKIDWPYIYTINFDDGIERCGKYRAILPYKKFNIPKTSKKLLYKLHGDAVHEAIYASSPDDANENIIFSNSQYWNSIIGSKNRYILNYLKSDFCSRIVLFIGCSLKDEIDIKQVVDQCTGKYLPDSMRIIVRNEKPSLLEEMQLSSYGISHVLLVNSYEAFYVDLVKKYKELQASVATSLYSYYNPATVEYSDKAISLSLLSHGNIFDLTSNTFKRGGLHVLRDAVQEDLSNLDEYTCVIVKGRRFSGKTSLLCDITRKVPQRDCFYFPSDLLPDEDLIVKLFNETRNGLFLFDSNTLSPDVYGYILGNEPLLLHHNHRIVMCVNSSDNYTQTKIKTCIVELNSVFHRDELLQNRTKADTLGISRRKPSNTNDDYLYLLSDNHLVDLSFLDIDVSQLDFWGYMQLILLSALDKVYFSDAAVLGITNLHIGNFMNVCGPLVEYLPCTPDEATKHSGKKLVHNSKLALINALSRCDDQKIVECIIYIVRNCRSYYSHRRFYIEIILFDTLNQLFAPKPKKQQLVSRIYEELSVELNSDLHYWLQRSKCLYRYETSREKLTEAYSYAKKVYDDGWEAIHYKSALTVSLICCALAEKDRGLEKDQKYQDAVHYASEAIFSDYYQINKKFLSNDLSIARSQNSLKRIQDACRHVLRCHSGNAALESAAQELLQYLTLLTSSNLIN